jgi:protease YdgD
MQEFPMRPDKLAGLATRLVCLADPRQWGNRQRSLRAALVGAAVLVTLAATTTERIAPLAAVGRLDVTGHPDQIHCTATLIAPTRAITAAHCMEPPATMANTAFRPAFSGGRGTEELLLSGWAVDSDARDVALLCLSSRAVTVALPRAALPPVIGEGLTVVGYAIPSEHGQTHDSCTVDEVRDDATFVLDCPLRPGTSGAPVLRHTVGGREIVGVISATSNRQSLATDVSAVHDLPTCK